MPHIGIDEKSFAKGQSYFTLLYDLDRGTVEAIAEGSDTEAGNACFSQLSAEQRSSVQAIAMDMSAAYVKSAKACIPLAEEKIVHDRFHVMKLVTEAVDQVRRTEHKILLGGGDDRLKGTRYLWLTSQENLTEQQRQRFDQAYHRHLATSKAWGYKMLRELWDHSTVASAKAWFTQWYRRVIHTNLKPLTRIIHETSSAGTARDGEIQCIVAFWTDSATTHLGEAELVVENVAYPTFAGARAC